MPKLACTDQEYLDLAALEDRNRPIVVYGDDRTMGDDYKLAPNKVKVKVSSYRLESKMTLLRLVHDTKYRQRLKPAIHDVVVLVPWLLATARPEIAEWIQETLEGTKIHRVGGANAGTDAFALLLHGKSERDKSFLSLPQGHRPALFRPIAPPSLPWSRPKTTKSSQGKAASKPGSSAHGVGGARLMPRLVAEE